MPVDGFSRLRNLGNLEKYSSTRHALGLYNNVSVTAYYSKSARTETQSLVPVIHLALTKLVTENPVLSAIPVEEDQPTAHFLRLPGVDLKRAVTFIERKQAFTSDASDDRELDDVLQQQHNTNFKDGLGDAPFWRLIILHHRADVSNFVAAFVFHHSLADGRSGLALHRMFHAALLESDTGISRGREPRSVIASPQTALIPSLEQLHPLPFTMLFIISFIWNMIFPAKVDRLWTGRPIDFSYQKRRIRTVVISREDTLALLAASRAQGVSLTATVPVLLAISVFCNLDAMHWQAVIASTPISLRHCLPSDTVTDDTIGVYVSSAQTSYKRADLFPLDEKCASHDAVWAAARNTKASLVEAVSRKGKNDVVGLLRWAGPLKAYMAQKEGKQPDASYEFSNVGVFKYLAEPPQDGWKVGRVVFGQDGNVVGPAFQTTGATGPDGELTITFAWLDGQVDESWVEEVMQGFKSEVKRLAAPER